MKFAERLRRGWTASFYNTGISLYRLAVKAAALRSRKARLLSQGQKQIWEYLDRQIMPGEKYVWIHTSSLGEFEQGRPLMELLKKTRPDLKILLTFFSPSGYEVRRNWSGADVVCYLPFDLPKNVERFLEKTKPVAAIFVKYEFWRNYLLSLQNRGVPTFLVSGIFREGQVFFRRGGKWYRKLLECFTCLMVQDEGSRRLLEKIGVTGVVVCGDTRFDRVSDILNSRRDIPELQRFTKDADHVFMAGSSWAADEAVYLPWLKAHPEVKAVIAPHEFDKERVDKLLSDFPGEAISWTQVQKNENLLDTARVLVMDCFGLLSAAYRYATLGYVGGGFGAGLHNINEAAVYSIPVMYGPNNAKFIEAREMKAAGGGFEVKSVEDFNLVADKLLSATIREHAGKAAGAYIRSKLGATQKVYKIIATHLPGTTVDLQG